MKTYRDYGIDAPEYGSGEHRTVCPSCEPRRKHKGNKDLSVSLDKKTWMCHHCGFTGGLGVEAGKATITNIGGNPPKNKQDYDVSPDSAFTVPELTPLSPVALEFLKKRGISQDVARSAGVMTANLYFHKLGRYGEAIAFPVRQAGQIVNVKYRAIEAKDFAQSKGGNQSALFNGDSMTGADTIVFTEGEFDTLSVMEAGFKCAVSCPNGAPPPNAKNIESKLSFIEANREVFDAAERVILAMDKDEPGLAFEKLLADKIGLNKCLSVEYPEECKDANDVLMKHGKEALAVAIHGAKPYPVNGITTFLDYSEPRKMDSGVKWN